MTHTEAVAKTAGIMKPPIIPRLYLVKTAELSISARSKNKQTVKNKILYQEIITIGSYVGMTMNQKAPWWQRGVIYQIYPRSFQDSNQDGIGDLRGIISRLDYLNDGTENSLGVDAIWISPVYPSPMKDFGYDISDYSDIDPLFGNMSDFETLLGEAHKRGIKVIMDLVINHTSDQHPWFIESRESKDNPKRDWYIWKVNRGKKPNNWYAAFEMRNAWWLDEKTNEYYLGTFTRHQPELNWRNTELRKAVYAMIRYWLDLGVDGFRMDVVNWYIKDEQFRSNPWKLSLNPIDVQKHLYDRNQPKTHEICREIRRITDQYPERMLVGEIYANDLKEAVSYHGSGQDELHMAFNFSFLFQSWSAGGFYENITQYYDLLPKGAWPNFTLSNHDQPRHFCRYRDGENTEPRARVAAALLLTLWGTPFLYYGEEIGMTCEKIPRQDLRDPLGKRGWPFLRGRDAERTPMQWDDTEYAGFSTVKPWLPVNSDYITKNVKTQARDGDSLLSFYRKLSWLRKRSLALTIGDIEFIDKKPEHVLSYKRLYQGEEIIILLNFSKHIQNISIPDPKTVRVLLGTHRPLSEELDLPKLQLHPQEVLIMAKV